LLTHNLIKTELRQAFTPCGRMSQENNYEKTKLHFGIIKLLWLRPEIPHTKSNNGNQKQLAQDQFYQKFLIHINKIHKEMTKAR